MPDGPTLFWIAAAISAALDGNRLEEMVPLRGARESQLAPFIPRSWGIAN